MKTCFLFHCCEQQIDHVSNCFNQINGDKYYFNNLRVDNDDLQLILQILVFRHGRTLVHARQQRRDTRDKIVCSSFAKRHNQMPLMAKKKSLFNCFVCSRCEVN